MAFFSYSRSDSDFVLKLGQDLKRNNALVWLDQLDIKAGEHWDEAIQAALSRSKKLLVVLSPASVKSQNVMDEVSFAFDEQKLVIPVLYRDCTIPFRLRRVQYIDFRSDYGNGLQHLVSTLILGSAPMPESLRKPLPKKLAKTYWIMGAIAIFLIACAFGLLLSRSARNAKRAEAELNQSLPLAGTWVKSNDQPATDIVKIEINQTGNQVHIDAWEKCEPKNCQLGTKLVQLEENALEVAWDQGNVRRLCKITRKGQFLQMVEGIVEPGKPTQTKTELFVHSGL